MAGEVNSMEGMDLMVEGMDRLAVADLLTQVQGGLRPCPYKVFSKSAAIDENKPDVGIWVYHPAWPKVSPFIFLPFPASPLSKSHLLLFLHVRGSILHHTGL